MLRLNLFIDNRAQILYTITIKSMKGNFEMNDKLLDKRRKYYLILDTETATLPFVKSKNYTEANRKKIAIMKPLVYDIGWKIIDRQGRTYRRKNYLISEIFCNWEIFC